MNTSACLRYILLYNICYYSLIFAQNYPCFHKTKQALGQCTMLTYCPQAVIELRQSIYPQTCKFDGIEVVVCCVPLTNDTYYYNMSLVGARSLKACHKYEPLSYKFEQSSTEGNILKPENICQWNHKKTINSSAHINHGSFPHLALIGYRNNKRLYWECAGSLISENYILTAAHCTISRYYDKALYVRLGDLQYANPNDDSYVQQIKIKSSKIYPNYSYPSRYHDLALLELEKPANLSVYVKPICLYPKHEIEPRNGIVAGWGQCESNDLERDKLLETEVKILDTEACNMTYSYDRKFFSRGVDNDYQFCSVSYIKEENTCYGDEGGPLQVFHDQAHCSYYLVGVTSTAKDCGHSNAPALYTKIFPYIEWIESIVWP